MSTATRRRCCACRSTAIFEALRIYMGSAYVNDFNMFGRTYRVTAQADGDFRTDPANVANIRVRSSDGAMVPLGSLVSFRSQMGPERLPRYNLFPTVEISGQGAPGVSSGQALDDHARAGRRAFCRQGMTYEWTDLSFQERRAASTGYWVFVLSIVFVFLALAALYESWALPLAIILIVPMCLFSGVFGVRLHGFDINILTQIGFVVLIGLAAKNAILIVEFARQLEDQGKDRVAAAVEACRHAAAADPDDVADLHARRDAALSGGRRGRGDARRAGHGDVLGHDRRDAVRPDLHAGVLHRDPRAGGATQIQRGCRIGDNNHGRAASRGVSGCAQFLLVILDRRAPVLARSRVGDPA